MKMHINYWNIQYVMLLQKPEYGIGKMLGPFDKLTKFTNQCRYMYVSQKYYEINIYFVLVPKLIIKLQHLLNIELRQMSEVSFRDVYVHNRDFVCFDGKWQEDSSVGWQSLHMCDRSKSFFVPIYTLSLLFHTIIEAKWA